MNYRTSTMQKSNNWRVPSDGSVAHKLLSIELEHHHETQSLRREIKRLRAEVGLMARLRNFHKAETDRLAEILRKLPPPIIPTRETTKVATPPNPQNDTTVQERGRPRERDGNGSDNSTSREDGKTRTSEKGKGRGEDTPMTEGPDHTTGEKRNDTSSTQPKRSASRQRTPSVVTLLRKKRATSKTPAPPTEDTEKDEEITKARMIRRKTKETQRKKADEDGPKYGQSKKEEDKPDHIEYHGTGFGTRYGGAIPPRRGYGSKPSWMTSRNDEPRV